MFAEELRLRQLEAARGIRAYWLEVSSPRSRFVADLSAELADLPVLVLPVSTGEFEDPNGMSDDLNGVLNRCRDWFSHEHVDLVIREERLSIVLVSKRPLGVPQISSPVELPDWFPVWPGHLLSVTIERVNDSVGVSIGSNDVPISDLKGALFDLEGALRDRLEHVYRSSQDSWARLCAHPGTGWSASDFAARVFQDSRSLVGERRDFRPGGGRESPYIVSFLHRMWCDCSHNGLHAIACDLADALAIGGRGSVPLQFSLPSLVARPFKPPLADTPRGIVFSRNVILLSAQSIQLCNAASHADGYPRFPAILTIGYVSHLAQSCSDAARYLSDIRTQD